jgi:hypothetical protein
MSFREVVAISKIIFGVTDDNKALLTEFMGLVIPDLVGKKSESGDSRRIDITQFLHLAVVGYHQMQADESLSQHKKPAGSGGGTVEKGIREMDAPEMDRNFEVLNLQQSGSGGANLGATSGSSKNLSTYLQEQKAADHSKVQKNSKVLSSYFDTDPMQGAASVATSGTTLTPPQPPPEANAAQMQMLGLPQEGEEEEEEQEAWEKCAEQNASDEEDKLEYESIQVDREREFLTALCEPLEDMLSEESFNFVLDEMFDQVRTGINIAFEEYNPRSHDEFDEVLARIISSDEFVHAMSATRDYLVQTLD